MGFLLTDLFDDSFKWNNKTYNVDMAFNNILLLFEMFDDDSIDKVEKPFIAMQMLIKESLPEFESIEQAMNLFKYIMKEFLDIEIDQEDKQNDKKVFDFKKDAEIIYASFIYAYKIDLFEMHDKLHWNKFLALLTHLDDDSKFKQVVGYRKMKIPSTNEVSKEYRDHIISMKEAYDLGENDREERVNQVMDNFANMLKLNSKVVD
jgi:hypothetical protein